MAGITNGGGGDPSQYQQGQQGQITPGQQNIMNQWGPGQQGALNPDGSLYGSWTNASSDNPLKEGGRAPMKYTPGQMQGLLERNAMPSPWANGILGGNYFTGDK